LATAGYAFEALDPGEVEDAVVSAASPEELAAHKAHAKAQHVATQLRPPHPAIVVASDTLVVLGSEVIGKPRDREDAARILTRLAGARQRVISGLCLWPVGIAGAEPQLDVATTSVLMHPMTAAQIAEYVASGASDGKAGAYAIQEGGDRFVAELDGSFLNVVGFPLELFEERLAQAQRRWGMG
jgi:septum formation protein